MNLNDCFKEYCNEGQPFLRNLKGDKFKGKAFACFATSIILHSVFRKLYDDIASFFTDNPGDGKIDGIAFSIDNKPIHEVGQLRKFTITSDSKINLYFIQSKKHKTAPFSKDEFLEFSRGVKSLVAYEAVADNPSEQMQQWQILWRKIKNECKKSRPKVYVHFYYATWSSKPNFYDFYNDEKRIREEIKRESGIKIAGLDYTWADGEWLAEHYTSHKQNNVGNDRKPSSFEMGYRMAYEKARNTQQSGSGNRNKKFSERRNVQQGYNNFERQLEQGENKLYSQKRFVIRDCSVILNTSETMWFMLKRITHISVNVFSPDCKQHGPNIVDFQISSEWNHDAKCSGRLGGWAGSSINREITLEPGGYYFYLSLQDYNYPEVEVHIKLTGTYQ